MYRFNPFTRMLGAMLSTELQCVKVHWSSIMPHTFTIFLVDYKCNASLVNSPFSILHPINPVLHGPTTLWMRLEVIWKILATPKLAGIVGTRNVWLRISGV